MEIYVNVYTAFAIKNCDSKDTKKKLEFKKDDLLILDKYKKNLE